jgi:hypothetical protein
MMEPQAQPSSSRSVHLDTADPDLARSPHLDIPALPQRLQVATQSQSQPKGGPPAALRLESDGDGASANDGTSPSYLVVSGGTGCNAICAAFARACYVLPVSDDGGSSSEIIRVLGGPSIGT